MIDFHFMEIVLILQLEIDLALWNVNIWMNKWNEQQMCNLSSPSVNSWTIDFNYSS